MKQVQKTSEIIAKLQAAYGPSADIADLAVFQVGLMNTLPLRKSSGLYKGATNTVELMGQMAAATNGESVPVNLVHGAQEVSGIVGRLFSASVVNAELMGLVAIDGKNHPDIVSKMDNGTIDQVSVGLLPAALNCSACGFDFMGPDATFDNVWTATCANDHVMGTDSAHINITQLGLFYELSLVPMGAVKGARVVDPAQYSEPLKLAASAKGLTAFAVELSATPKEEPVNTAEFTAAITAAATEKATLTAAVAEKDVALTAATAEVTSLKAKVVELEAAAVEFAKGELSQVKVALTAAEAAVAGAVTYMTAEAKKILTACGMADHSGIPTDLGALTTLVEEKRAQFAAAIPVGGRVGTEPKISARPTGAFSAPARS